MSLSLVLGTLGLSMGGILLVRYGLDSFAIGIVRSGIEPPEPSRKSAIVGLVFACVGIACFFLL